LNQIIAVASGKKTGVEKTLTEIYHKIQKPEIFAGLTRVYRPLNEEGETLPKEEKLPQQSVLTCITEATEQLAELINVIGTQDLANTQAKSNIVVDGEVVVKDVPVTHLLYLEKQLTDIKTFVSKLPTLDLSETWTFDANSSMFKTGVVETNRNVKRYKNHVKAEATDKHPAQVDVYTEDEKVGTWNTTKFSTCISVKDKVKMLNRVQSLIEAVKMAREEANSIEVTKVTYGDDVINFIFK
jgi:hypothetical protein